MKYDNHWFMYDRRHITILKSLGYEVHNSVWEIPKMFLEEMIIIDGTIYDEKSKPAPAIENLEELIIKDIPKEFEPIKLGISIKNWRREILPIQKYEINCAEDWIKVKKEIEDALLIKKELERCRDDIPGFTLDNIFLNCINTEFKEYKLPFKESGYIRLMLELGIPK